MENENVMNKTQTQQRLAIFLILAGVILISLWALASGFFSGSPDSGVNTSAAQNQPYPEVARIPLADARTLFEIGGAIILDVRDREDYEAAHIPGAVSMPLAELQLRYQELPKDREIITYCT